MRAFQHAAVERKFQSYPRKIRSRLLALRELIFNTAASIDGVGKIEETLTWGEPAYLTSETRSGTTIRIDWKESNPSQYAMYFHCQTNLVETFRAVFPDQLRFEPGQLSYISDAVQDADGFYYALFAKPG